MKTFDLVVVGTGAGLSVAQEALQRGWSVALVESGKFGGTCLTRGCIPSKILTTPADLIRDAERAERIGLKFEKPAVAWEVVARRMWKKIGLNREIENNLRNERGLTIFNGEGAFTAPMRMRVKMNGGSGFSEEFEGRRFVLASGARSIVPPIEGLDGTDFLTTENFFGDKFPERPWTSLILIGGGIVAAEFAHIFSALGTKVTIVEMLPRLLAAEEPEVSALVERVFREDISVRLNSKALSVREEQGKKIVVVADTRTGALSEAAADALLVAVGRKSNADLLRLEKTGVELTPQGWIKTDAFLETTRPNIWAIGDALGGFQFRHKANADADVVIHNLFAPDKPKIRADNSAVPWAVFTHPQVGHVGLTESQALETGLNVLTAVFHYSDVAKGFALGFEKGGPDDGFFKLVAEDSGRILGAHVVGPQAALLVQPFVYLMNSGYACPKSKNAVPRLSREDMACPEAGSIMPIYRSQVIHPSLNEVTAWALGALRPATPFKHQDNG
ncbi:MAG: FAD-dependent oxidoreductase [Candidatus Aminicenantes bacterium]|nr:FAD-dependent oxidoreductase [Candidatus Aminicenantes bacterium]